MNEQKQTKTPVSDKLLMFAQDLDRKRLRTKIMVNGSLKKMSQADISNAVGISTQTYQRYISENFMNCSLEVFVKIVRYLEENDAVVDI